MTQHVSEKRGVRMFSQEQVEPQELPEGRIKLTPYAYLRFWSCLRGDRTQTKGGNKLFGSEVSLIPYEVC